jgi:WD40 repeat protein
MGQPAFSAHPARLFYVAASGDLMEWDLRPGSAERILIPHVQWSVLQATPDGEYLAAVSKTDALSVWRTRTRERLYTFENSRGPGLNFVFSPDGKYLVYSDFDSSSELTEIHVHNASTGERLRHLNGNTADINELIFAPDGALFSSSSDCVIRAWNIETGVQLWAVSF